MIRIFKTIENNNKKERMLGKYIDMYCTYSIYSSILTHLHQSEENEKKAW